MMLVRGTTALLVAGTTAVITRPRLDHVQDAVARLDLDPDAALLAMARCAGFVTAVWTTLALVLVLIGTAPGRLGALGRSVQRCVLPAAARRAVAGAVGLGLVLAPAAASARAPEGPTVSAGPTTPPAPGWPVGPGDTAPAGDAPAPVWPTTTPRPHRTPGTTVVVHPGDSLWTIARTRLGRAASERRVATAWPAWWAANRAVVGADPDLIRPGQVLHAPASVTAHPTDRTPGGTS